MLRRLFKKIRDFFFGPACTLLNHKFGPWLLVGDYRDADRAFVRQCLRCRSFEHDEYVTPRSIASEHY